MCRQFWNILWQRTQSHLRGIVYAKQRFQERDDAILFEFFIVSAAYRCGRIHQPILFALLA
jgi:hypothetical protein